MAERAPNRGGDPDLHFTIGSATGHDSAAGLDLHNDLALVKATLLYADRVKLCSVGASLLSGIAEFQEASAEARARLVVKFLPDLQPSMTARDIHFFEAVVGMRGRDEKRRIPKKTRRKILAMVDERQEELETMVLEQHRAAGIEGLREAVRSGLLEVHPFRETSAEAIVEATIRGGGNLLYGVELADLLEEFLEQAMGAVEDAHTYPLFDDLTGDFIGEAIRHGVITPTEAVSHEADTAASPATSCSACLCSSGHRCPISLVSGASLRHRCGASGSPFPDSHARSARRCGSQASQRKPIPFSGRG